MRSVVYRFASYNVSACVSVLIATQHMNNCVDSKEKVDKKRKPSLS